MCWALKVVLLMVVYSAIFYVLITLFSIWRTYRVMRGAQVLFAYPHPIPHLTPHPHPPPPSYPRAYLHPPMYAADIELQNLPANTTHQESESDSSDTMGTSQSSSTGEGGLALPRSPITPPLVRGNQHADDFVDMFGQPVRARDMI